MWYPSGRIWKKWERRRERAPTSPGQNSWNVAYQRLKVTSKWSTNSYWMIWIVCWSSKRIKSNLPYWHSSGRKRITTENLLSFSTRSSSQVQLVLERAHLLEVKEVEVSLQLLNYWPNSIKICQLLEPCPLSGTSNVFCYQSISSVHQAQIFDCIALNLHSHSLLCIDIKSSWMNKETCSLPLLISIWVVQ